MRQERALPQTTPLTLSPTKGRSRTNVISKPQTAPFDCLAGAQDRLYQAQGERWWKWTFIALTSAGLIGDSAPAPSAAPPIDGTAILARATEAAGGSDWANARTLILRGRAVFWDVTGAAPKSAPDTYVMYREFDPNRQAAHGAEGKLRIIVADQGKLDWTVGYDGTDTWTEKGVVPKAEADAMWASNFGFGIIRHAAKPGFKSERLPDDAVDGFPTYMVRLTDPTGTVSLFGVDKRSYALRMVGFATPRGWHLRTYSGFFRPKSMPRWLQAAKVTLYYNGVKQNEIHWKSAQINPAIAPSVFAQRSADLGLDVAAPAR